MADIDFKNGVNVDSAYMDGHKVRLIAIPDGSLELPISATSDSGYVVDANGKKHRVLLATFLNGTPDYKLSTTADSAYMTVDGQKVKVRLVAKLTNSLELPSSANADQGYALGDDSKKHRVTLVATPTGTLELPNSETDDSAYVVDGNGKKYKVRLFFLAYGGAKEVIIKGVAPLSLPDAIANSLSYVKAFGGTEQRNLPVGYTQLAYIGSAGTQYIDLGYKGNGNTKVEVKFRYYQTSSASGSGRVFGSRTTSTSNAFAIGSASGIISSNNDIFWCYDGQPYFVDDTNFGLGEWKTIVFSATEHTIDGVTAGDDYTVTTFETPETLKLFGFDNNGTMGVGYVDIAYCQLWDSGVLIRDLVPCKNASNVVGMYDLVNDVFYQNAGTGDFVAGPTAVPTPDAPMDIVSNNGVLKAVKPSGLPLGITKAEYLRQSYTASVQSYSQQHFDTMYIPQGDEVVEFSFKINTLPSLNYIVLFGSRIGSSGTATTNFWFGVNSTGTVFCRIGTVNPSVSLTMTTGIVYNCKADISNGVLTINGSDYAMTGTTVSGITDSLYLFALNQGGGGATLSCAGSFDLYDFRISRNGQLVYTAIPTTTPGIFDTVSEQENTTITGSYGALTAGPAATDPITIIADGTMETIEDTIGNTATAEMLLKVGDYQDVQSIIDGVVTRKVGVKVLDGSESFAVVNNTFRYALYGLPMNTKMICSHFDGDVSPSVSTSNQPDLTIKNNANNNNNAYFKYTAKTTIGDFQQWLAAQYAAGTPVIIVYPLATSTTESVTGQTLQVQDGDNTLEITQASLTGLELEAEYKAAVSLTIQEVQDANLDPNVEVTIS